MLISLGRDSIVSPFVSTHSQGVIINRIAPDLQSALTHYRGFVAASYFHYIWASYSTFSAQGSTNIILDL